jgi:hypothetical protein
MVGIGLGEVVIVLFLSLAMAVLQVWPAWRICVKAGLPGPMGLLAMIPGGLIPLLFLWAFGEWPAHRARPASEQFGI